METLLEKVERDITEAGKFEIYTPWRLAIAYNACPGCAKVALRVSGYRAPEGDGHHYCTIESLRFTLKPAAVLILTLHSFPKKRSIVSYDAAGTVSGTEAAEVLKLASELAKRLQDWLRAHHPELL